MLEMVDVAPHPPERFESVLEPEPFEKLADGIRTARELLGERTVWNVSSTAKGGGVVELLLPLIGYAKGAGVDARWAVIEGNPEFFKVTKRVHNRLHGFEGDGGELDDEARKIYERRARGERARARGAVGADDVVLLHDPQTAGLIGAARAHGREGDLALPHRHRRAERRRARRWDFLRADVEQADAYVFSREQFVWEGLDDAKVQVIAAVDRRLQRQEPGARARAGRRDPGRRGDRRRRRRRADVQARRRQRGARRSQAELFEDVRLTTADKIVLQVSRWDRLKDPRA